jgi:phosphatidylserine/phosphatidylglycerophosphate/cardiolipin synthase-like enzyme
MFKKCFCVSCLILFAITLISWNSHATDLTLNAPTKIFFSPNGGATQAIIKEINDAKSEILVQVYSFTSSPIAKALVDANKRGVQVEAILDKSQRKEKHSEAAFLSKMKLPTYIDSKHTMANNKIMIIDKTTVITGSFNFTTAAEQNNAENLLVIKSKELAKIYLENWDKHKEHSEDYKGKQPIPMVRFTMNEWLKRHITTNCCGWGYRERMSYVDCQNGLGIRKR